MDGCNSTYIEVAKYIRAKSYGKKYLYSHIAETINKVIQFEEFLEKNGFLSLASDSFNSVFDQKFFENLTIACFLHDLGKFNPHYHKYLEKRTECHEEKNEIKKVLNFFKGYENLELEDHEAVSVIFSFIFLEDNLDNSRWNEKIRTAILLHHYNDFYSREIPHIATLFDRYPDLEKYLNFLLSKKGEIRKILEIIIESVKSEIQNKDKYRKILDKLKNNIGFERLEKLKERLVEKRSLSSIGNIYFFPRKDNDEFYKFLVFLGVLRRCDYSASAEVEMEKNVSLEKEVFNNLEEKIRKKIVEKTKEKNFYFWQEEVIKKFEDKKEENVILIAPTGSGKTEFALLWAKKIGKRKLIYTLPLRAALNDIFLRVTKEDKGDKYFEAKHVGLLHSTAFIEYMEFEKLYEEDIESLESLSRLFSFPIQLTTPDQVFLVCLKYYGCDKVLSIYPISLLVVDEIQSYTPEMAAILIKSLEIAKLLGSSILIMTATYPPYFKKFFEKQGIKEIDISEFKDKIKNYKLKRHKIKIIKNELFVKSEKSDKLKVDKSAFEEIKKIIEEKTERNNILIVVNTVGKAIELYKELEKLYKRENRRNVYLLHSRLVEKEKEKRIKEIKNRIEEKKEKGIILVATQVVEASVDIDFDILITEISPIDSQIQRWGRIYRNRDEEGDYEGEPNIYILVPEKIDESTSKYYDNVYDKDLIKKTIEVLEEKSKEEKVYDYDEERKLIDEVFERRISNNKTLKEYYEEKIEEILRELNYISVEKKSEAQEIFRKIAGLQVVVYELMKQEEDEENEKTYEEKVESKLGKIFGEVIEEKIKEIINGKRKGKEISWKDIIEDIKKKVQDDEIRNEIEKEKERLKEKLRKLLYLYSVNLPYFLLFERRVNVIPFKGFYILYDERIKNYCKEIREYGIDEYFESDIDSIVGE